MTSPLPSGFRIELDPGTRQLAPDLWFGGAPPRILRLTAAGQAAWQELQAGPVATRAGGLLARKLTDAGLAHPRPPKPRSALDVTVVIPVYARQLATLDVGYPVVVVDDGSPVPVAIPCGATLIRRAVNGGPGAARNTALESVASEFVAFLDSDCVPPPGWIEALAAHFADPLVAAVAPRITSDGALDLGADQARVLPGGRVTYVPTAALVCRRSALPRFDESLRTGEDVDLVWRLHEAGWRIRYEPAVQVRHIAPATWPARMARRFRYGTSAAPLARRHPGAVTHLVLHPWPAATVVALLARRPGAAALAFTAGLLTTGRTLRRAGVPRDGLVRAMVTGVAQTWLGIGRYGTQFGAPALAAAVAARGGRWRRAAAASLLLGPARFSLPRIAGEVAYGAGVWSGCWSERTFAPLRPAIAWRPLRIEERT
jgi:mycofactocin system glycosyltransferase